MSVSKTGNLIRPPGDAPRPLAASTVRHRLTAYIPDPTDSNLRGAPLRGAVVQSLNVLQMRLCWRTQAADNIQR